MILILFAGLLYFERYHKVQVTIPSTSPTKTVASSAGGQNSPSANLAPSGEAKSLTSAIPTSGSLIAPSGGFVSNHHPGNGTPTNETSVCNTSPGATCYIQFAKGSEVKKLDTQTADSNGATYWYWDVNTAGFGSGSWTISAFASLSSQTKTASDSQPLVVP